MAREMEAVAARAGYALSANWEAGFDLQAAAKARSGRLGVDFSRAQQEVLRIELRGAGPVCVRQDADSKSLGAVVWNCGLQMCHMLEALAGAPDDSWLAGQHVLELGSGTDLPELCGTLQENVEMNAPELGSSTVVRNLAWGSQADEEAALAGRSWPTLVLCSDILYEPRAYAGLLDTLARLASPSTGFLFAVKLRFPDTERAFFCELQSRLAVRLVAVDTGASSPQDAGIALLAALPA